MNLRIAHDELSEPLVLHGPEEVQAWAKRELEFWAKIKPSGSQTTQQHTREAMEALQRIVDAAKKEPVSETALNTAIATALPSLRILSTAGKGAVLDTMFELGYEPSAVTMAYASFFKRDEVKHLMRYDQHVFDCVAGLAHVAAFEAGGEPHRLVQFLRTIQEEQSRWAAYIASAKAETEKNRQAHETAVGELQKDIAKARESVGTAATNFASEIEEIKSKFEQQFALRTPMTYWTEKAQRHAKEARTYRWWFSSLLCGGITALGAVCYFWLFPFLATHPNAYWALILFSVAIALLAWPLRITSKLYLVHRHLFEDATEREVIARTFLALGEQVKLSDADRQLLLGALMRPAGISLVGDESGLNIADVILAKTLAKS